MNHEQFKKWVKKITPEVDKVIKDHKEAKENKELAQKIVLEHNQKADKLIQMLEKSKIDWLD